MSTPYRTCHACGASLDAGERCTCMDKKEPETKKPNTPNNLSKVFQKYAAIVVIYTETSGLNSDLDQIIELAAIRVEQNADGHPVIKDRSDQFIKLRDGQMVPEKTAKRTGITDEMLATEGVHYYAAATHFSNMVNNAEGPVLLVSHGAQFDLSFLRKLVDFSKICMDRLEATDYLDTITVFKDRRPYPHTLGDAIAAYKLQDKVQNCHRAIDAAEATLEVLLAMDNERADLLTYVNLFGYDPKYGVRGRRIDGVTYWPQHFHTFMVGPNDTLPVMRRRALNQ